MSDQCKNCICRGDLEWCATTPCSVRGSWYAEKLKDRIEALESMSNLTDFLHPNPRVMLPTEMHEEWQKGCTIAGPMHDKMVRPEEPTSPAECAPCTEGLISALMVRIGEYESLLKQARGFIHHRRGGVAYREARRKWVDQFNALGLKLEEENAGSQADQQTE